MNPSFRIWLLWGLAAACCLPGVTPPLALAVGLVLALTLGNPQPKVTAKVQQYLLQASVVGLGFGLKLDAVGRAGATGVGATAVSLALTVLLGWGLAKLLKVERITGQLITTGTAICGGSAIAAMGPVLGASPAGDVGVARLRLHPQRRRTVCVSGDRALGGAGPGGFRLLGGDRDP